MARGICILLLVVVAAVSTSGYSSYGSYGTKVYNRYPIYKSVVIRHSSHHGYHGFSFYKKYHGFKISHRRFSYHGLGYKLRCGKSRFYRLWRRCYGKYHSRNRCFGVFRKRHLFGTYKGHGYGGGYLRYYKKYHGFKLRHNRFFYGGYGYKLRCSRRRFYRSWRSCYTRYHSRRTCFGYLRKRHLFGIYHTGSSYGGVFGGYTHGKYSYGYYRRHHGFQIRHNRFLYHGTSYQLICSSSRFYRLWSNCYDQYHSIGACFGRLRRQHLFYKYVGGSSYGGVFGGYNYGKYSYGYYRRHHGFQISHNRFLYHGVSYQLKCSRSRFYRLWSDCYDNYHSVDACFGRLRRQHLFYTYGGGHYGVGLNYLYKHKKIADYHVNRIHHVANKHVARISHLSNKHERNIAYQAQKHVHRISSVANKHINRFKALVDFHINRLHQHTKHHLSALEYQHKRHLNDREYQNKKHQLNVKYLHVKHEHYINKLHGKYDYGTSYGGGLGHVVSYLDYYKKFHGFKISHNRFSYGGKAYALKCGLQQFYNSWSDCWSSYHRRSICFGRLMKNNLFELYSGDYDVGYAPKTVVVKTVAYGDDSHY